MTFRGNRKYRAARRVWHKTMTERFGAKSPVPGAAIHAQTAGCSLTAQQPYNNVVRTALQALAAVMAAPSPCYEFAG